MILGLLEFEFHCCYPYCALGVNFLTFCYIVVALREMERKTVVKIVMGCLSDWVAFQ